MNISDIRSKDWSLRLGALGEIVTGIDDVAQCLAIILTTPKGSDPLRPNFGADMWKFVDSPMSAVLPGIVREVRNAVTAWEPRINVISIGAVPALGDGQAGAHLRVTISWRLKLEESSAAPHRTTVSIAGVV